jgi:hypothetical protein
MVSHEVPGVANDFMAMANRFEMKLTDLSEPTRAETGQPGSLRRAKPQLAGSRR